jgi:serine/threonine protein kinase
LGEGAYGKVFLAEDPNNKRMYAIKSMITSFRQKSVLKEIEMTIGEKTFNPCVLRYYCYFEEGFYTHIVMEYCDLGDLSHFMEEQENPLEEEVFS